MGYHEKKEIIQSVLFPCAKQYFKRFMLVLLILALGANLIYVGIKYDKTNSKDMFTLIVEGTVAFVALIALIWVWIVYRKECSTAAQLRRASAIADKLN